MGKKTFLLTAVLVGMVFAVFPETLSAQERGQYITSNNRIDTIHAIINKAVAEKLDLTNSSIIQSIYDRIGEEMPLVPEEPLIQIDLQALNEKARAITEKKYKYYTRKEMEEKLRPKAQEKFPMDKLRDRVTVNHKRGTTSGTLYRITANNILVNNTTISFIDMDEETRSRFSKQTNQALQDAYIQERIAAYLAKVSTYQQNVFNDLLLVANKENEKNGYICLEKTGTWTTAKEIASSALEGKISDYKKMKEKQERIQRKREKEAAAAAKKKAEEEAAAQMAADSRKDTDPDGKKPEGEWEDAEKSSGSSTDTYAAENMEMSSDFQNPQDMFAEKEELTQLEEGGQFIALTQEQLAQLSRPKVSETAYRELMERVQKEKEIINSTYYGIDADQGFKNAIWGFKETDVYYALSKEQDAAFLKKNRLNRNDIIYPQGSRPQKIYLHYKNTILYKVDIYMGDLNQKEFEIYRNSLNLKYDKSNTEKRSDKDLYMMIVEGKITPEEMPNDFLRETASEGKPGQGEPAAENVKKDEKQKAETAGEVEKPYIFVWEGQLSRGVLSFFYDPQTRIYKDVLFEKTYLPERLQKLKNAESDEAR